MRTVSMAVMVAFLGACGPQNSIPSSGGGTAATGGGTAAGGGGGAMVTGPTWAQDVAPLVSKNCSGCHVSGGIAPFALGSYADAKPMAAAMAADVASKKMPPWMPGADTPALQHARVLTDAEIATFQAWAANGAPEGDTAHAAMLPPPEVIPFGPADVSFDTGADYVPDATLTDDYRCFLADPGVDADQMAMAFQVTPGNRKVVHHVIVTLFDQSSLSQLQALDQQWAGPGWQCFGGPVPSGSGINPVGSLGAWVPGVAAVAYPTGTANRFPAHALAVIQVHYNLAGGDDPDRTAVQVQFAPAATAGSLLPIKTMPLIRHNLSIPPGAVEHLEQNTALASTWALGKFPTSGEAYAIGVAGHMHLLGRHFEIVQSDANGEHVLLDLPAWDFHWQGIYYFQEPILVKSTDSLSIRCTYDNPGTQAVTWGEGTTDEMCLGQLQFVETRPPY
ncbi:MAG: hypothetical protein QM723_07515 [Myxococcaceae bacterium]